MACNKPMYRISEEFLTPSDKKYARNGGLVFGLSELNHFENRYSKEKIITIGCGQCMGCRLDKAQEWAIRSSHESSLYDFNLYVTLTMDANNLLFDDYLDFSIGEVHYCASLDDHDLVKFMKDLRELYRVNAHHIGIRLLGSGEYGDIGDLPHYHLLLFNCPPLDDFLSWYDADHHLHFLSDTFNKLWTYGFVDIQPMCFESICYVSRYVTKKLIGKPRQAAKKDYGDLLVRKPDFLRMSRRPGIGAEYARKHFEEIYEGDAIVLNKRYETFLAKPPRYYDRLFESVDPESMEIVRGTRSEAGSLARDALLQQLAHKPLASYYDQIEQSLINKLNNSSCKL